MIDTLSHLSAKRIYFSYQVSLGTSADVWIAGHHGNRIRRHCKDHCGKSESGAGKRSFTACMSCTDDNHICPFFNPCHVSSLSHTESAENLIHQIFTGLLSSYLTECFIGTHQVYGIEILRHLTLDAF